jgi:hypothetical protein
MDRFSEEACSDAMVIKWTAERLAGIWRIRDGRPKLPSIPRQWTAWLLMDKAGVPRELIADACRVPVDRLGKRLLAATAMMMFPPYAARIEALMEQMPRFGAAPAHRRSPVKEAACAVRAG